jgi:ATP-dependent DNA helicase RecG
VQINSKNFTLVKIPAATSEPTCFKNKPFIRINSHVTELSKYHGMMRQIYNASIDWSAEIVENATINNLDPEAIEMARKKYKERNNKMADKIDSWSDSVFLDKAKLTVDGQITRAAIILLGKDESTHFLSPSILQLTWKLGTEEKAYEHFGLPIILTAPALADKIINYKYKFYLSEDASVYSEKVAQYIKTRGFDNDYYKKLI